MDSIKNNFIEGNSLPIALDVIKHHHTIPVFTKDNTVLISQAGFIDTVNDCLAELSFEQVSEPEIRVSHPVKGRIPEARYKSKEDLLPHEETLYYERMIFLNKINAVKKRVRNDDLSLIVGGVKAYNYDNLSRDSRAFQHFKVFIGFQVKVCSNLCIWTDGAVVDIKVNNLDTLRFEILRCIKTFQQEEVFYDISQLSNYSLSETQFAQLVGRLRLYQYLPSDSKVLLPQIEINDTQINSVVRNYYEDPHFSSSSGEIDLWNLYNLLTHACKSSYIDKFVQRSSGAALLTREIVDHLENKCESYFLV